jgi:hypothetical protein
MSITKTLLAGVAGTVLVGTGAMAAEPLKLTDNQMDDVTAGLSAIGIFGDVLFSGLGSFYGEGSADVAAKETVEIKNTPPFFVLSQTASAKATAKGGFEGLGQATVLGAPTPFGAFLSTFALATNFDSF